MEVFLSDLLRFVLGVLVIAFLVVTIRHNIRRKKAAQTDGNQMICCPKCHVNLQVPGQKGKLMIHCPKCGAQFLYDSGARPGASAKPQKPSAPPKPAKSPQSSVKPKPPKQPPNELDYYRPGGFLRQEINPNPTDTREALLNLIAVWASASVRNQLFDRNGELWQLLQQYGGRIESVLPEFTSSQLTLKFHFVNAPESGHNFQYSYNEIANKEGNAPIYLSDQEIEWVRCAALSHLADKVPSARMKAGRILA